MDPTDRSAGLAGAMLVVWCLGVGSAARAQVLDPGDAISRITAQDLTESLISLNNFTAAPGVEGSILRVDFGDGQPEVNYDRLCKIWEDELAEGSTFKAKKQITSMMRRIIGRHL